MRSRFTLAFVVVAGLVGLTLPAGAETTPGLDDARCPASDATGRVQKHEAEQHAARAELERLEPKQRVAVDRYTHAGEDDRRAVLLT